MKRTTPVVASFLAVLMMALVTRGQQPQAVDPRADEVLRKMGAALMAGQRVSFSAHAIVDQVSPDGQKLQYAKNQTVQLRRPDKLACDVVGDREDLQFRYDGKTVTLYNPRTKSWGATDAPASIEDTLDFLANRFGVAIPLADLVFPDPYKCLIENVRSGQYLGIGYVLDVKCHHLAFRQAAVDWQIWIEDGDKPLPRKVVITFKDSPGYPQYTAFLSNWNLAADVAPDAFSFTPPAGAKQVEFAPTTQPVSGAR